MSTRETKGICDVLATLNSFVASTISRTRDASTIGLSCDEEDEEIACAIHRAVRLGSGESLDSAVFACLVRFAAQCSDSGDSGRLIPLGRAVAELLRVVRRQADSARPPAPDEPPLASSWLADPTLRLAQVVVERAEILSRAGSPDEREGDGRRVEVLDQRLDQLFGEDRVRGALRVLEDVVELARGWPGSGLHREAWSGVSVEQRGHLLAYQAWARGRHGEVAATAVAVQSGLAELDGGERVDDGRLRRLRAFSGVFGGVSTRVVDRIFGDVVGDAARAAAALVVAIEARRAGRP